MLPFISETKNGVRLRIKVQPGAKKTELIGPEGENLKIKIQAPPVEGAANEALLQLLRKIFRVPKQKIHILRGDKSRLKQVEIEGLNLKDCLTVVLSHH